MLCLCMQRLLVLNLDFVLPLLQISMIYCCSSLCPNPVPPRIWSYHLPSGQMPSLFVWFWLFFFNFCLMAWVKTSNNLLTVKMRVGILVCFWISIEMDPTSPRSSRCWMLVSRVLPWWFWDMFVYSVYMALYCFVVTLQEVKLNIQLIHDRSYIAIRKMFLVLFFEGKLSCAFHHPHASPMTKLQLKDSYSSLSLLWSKGTLSPTLSPLNSPY